jgi:hypothetical protein
LVLLLSMMPSIDVLKEANVTLLSDREINGLINYYNSLPTPLTVIKH